MPFIDRSYFIGELNIPTARADQSALLDLLIQSREDELLTHLLGYQFYKNFKAGLQAFPVASMWTDLLNGAEFTDMNGRLRKWIGFVSMPVDMISAVDAANSLAVVVGRGLVGDPTPGSSTTTIPASLVGKNFILERRQFGPFRPDEISIVGNQLALLNGAIFSGGDTYFYKSVTLALNTTTGNNKRSLIANYVYYWYIRNNLTQSVAFGEASTKVENSVVSNPAFKSERAWNQMVEWIWELYAYLWINEAVYTDWQPYAWAYGWSPWYYPDTVFYRKTNSFGI